MAVETSSVEIRINVVDSNSGAVISSVTGNLEQLGAAGATTGKKVKKSMEEAGAGSLNALEQTRLATEEFGVRLPRAMVKLAAESKVAQAALSAVGTGLIALGTIQIGFMVFDQIYQGAKKIYEKWFDIDGVIEKYNEEAAKAASQKYDENRSLADLNRDLREANEQVQKLNEKRQNSPSWYAVGDVDPENGKFYDPSKNFTTGNAGSLGADQNKKDQAELQSGQRKHERIIQAIEDTKRLAEAGSTASEKAKIEENSSRATAEENFKYRLNLQKKNAEIYKRWVSVPEHARLQSGEKGYIDPVPEPSMDPKNGSYVQERNDEIAHALNQRQASDLEQKHAQNEEEIRLHNEAINARLHGDSLYAAQALQQIDTFKRKHMDSVQAINDIWDKFHAEEDKRNQNLARETADIVAQAKMAGLTGTARVRAEGDVREQKIQSDPELNKDTKDQRIAASKQQTNAELIAAQKTFTEKIDELAYQSAERQLQGFSRIDAEGKKQIHDLTLEYEKLYGQDPTAHQAHLGELNRGIGMIGQDTEQQKAELAHKNSEETAQIESQARVRSLSADKQQTAAIEAEYEERLRKYQEQLDRGEILSEDAKRRELAAEMDKNSKLVEESRNTREKMAGEFTRLFKDPSGFLKEMGDKAAGEMAAALFQRVQNRTGSGKGTSSSSSELLDKFYARIAGVPTGSTPPFVANQRANALNEHGVQVPGSAPSTSAEAARRINTTAASTGTGRIALATAQITVNSASISVAGGAAAGTAGMSSFSGGSSTAGTGISGTPDALTTSGVYGSTSNAGLPGATTAASAAAIGSGATGGSSISSGLSNISSGISLGQNVASLFHKQGSKPGSGMEVMPQTLNGTLNADGTFTDAKPKGTGMMNGGGVKENAMGAIYGAAGVYSAYKSNGGVSGALSGAMGGMQLGVALGGPMGAAIGLAAGAIIGAIGFGGREKARAYWLKDGRPRMQNDIDAYQHGSMDYLSAYSDIEALQGEADKTTKSMGPAAKAFFSDTIKKEIHQSEEKLSSEEKAGRSYFTATGAQYDWGGPIDNFGSYGDGPTHGMIRAKRGEYVIEQQQAMSHAGALNAINSGATYADMARYYGSESGTMAAQSQPSWSGDLHVHAVDAKSVAQLLMANKHVIRSAFNSALGENSGGADA